MKAPRRINDIRAKRLRAQVRAEGAPCHVCGQPIDYDAHHLDPASFQLDHLWQVALGGPEHDPLNAAAAHRACNRKRSTTVDAKAIATAAHFGVTLTPPPRQPNRHGCAPDGMPCTRCNGIHNPRPGCTFETTRRW